MLSPILAFSISQDINSHFFYIIRKQPHKHWLAFPKEVDVSKALGCKHKFIH